MKSSPPSVRAAWQTAGDIERQLVPADGGPPQDLTTLDAEQGEFVHRAPELVPGTRAVLFQVTFSRLRDPRIDAVMVDTGDRRVVVENAQNPRYLASGHLLFSRDDTVLIASFDAGRLALAGPAVPLIDEIRRDGGMAMELFLNSSYHAPARSRMSALLTRRGRWSR